MWAVPWQTDVAKHDSKPGEIPLFHTYFSWHIFTVCGKQPRWRKPWKWGGSNSRVSSTVAQRGQQTERESGSKGAKPEQIQKTSSSDWQHVCCKYTQTNKNTLQIDTTQPNTETHCKVSRGHKSVCSTFCLFAWVLSSCSASYSPGNGTLPPPPGLEWFQRVHKDNSS